MALTKFLPYLISESTPLSMGEKLRATFAAFFATLVVGLVSSQFLQGSGLHILVTSMGASAVLLFAAPIARSPNPGR